MFNLTDDPVSEVEGTTSGGIMKANKKLIQSVAALGLAAGAVIVASPATAIACTRDATTRVPTSGSTTALRVGPTPVTATGLR